MRNPFKKRKHITLGTGLVLGSVAIGIAGYLLYSKSGSDLRNKLADKVDRLRLKYFTNNEHADNHSKSDYLAHPTKAPKTDREKLLKGEILSADHAAPPAHEQNS